MKKIRIFNLKIFIFLVVKFSTYLNRRVFIMEAFKAFSGTLYEGPAKVLSLCSDYFSATFYRTYFYYTSSKYSPFTGTHFCNLFTQSRKADK